MDRVVPAEVREYFAAGRKIAQRVRPGEDYSVYVAYDDGAIRKYDIAPHMRNSLGILKDRAIFERVYIDDEGAIAWDVDPNLDSSLHWENHIDFDADTIYIYGGKVCVYT